MAVDIGTTHVSVAIFHLHNGRRIAMRFGVNPQSCYGTDIVGRLMAAAEAPVQKAELQKLIVDAIGDALLDLASREGLSLHEIGIVSMVGNSAMLLILCGGDAGYLLLPEHWTAPIECTPSDLPAWLEAWNLAPSTAIEIVQPLAGFVGSDIAAGLVHAEITSRQNICLFIDFGTNSEMALWDGRHLYVSSAAGGPAFEGMGINCGMAAELGAVSRIELNPGVDAEWELQVIGGGPPKGICGSGLVDLIAHLRSTRRLNETGQFQAADQTGFTLPGSGLCISKHDVTRSNAQKGPSPPDSNCSAQKPASASARSMK